MNRRTVLIRVLWVLGAIALLTLVAALSCSSDTPPPATETPVPTATVTPDTRQRLPLDVGAFDLLSGGHGGGAASGGEVEADSIEEVLEKGLRLAEASPVHIAFRGTAD